ncbi:MAG: hypothetical protein PVH88_08245 [Ignavibacteria bacterium]|jgi:asparagine synthetase B (glutamine-hydrolysing)
MCGIFGVIVKKDCTIEKSIIKDAFLKVAEYSEVRGKDSSGIAFRNEIKNELSVIKGPISISRLLKSKDFSEQLSANLINGYSSSAFVAIGHARLTTNGTQLKDINNQPVIKDGVVGIHNGIIVNVNELWAKNSELRRDYDIDTEILLALIRKELNKGHSTIQSCIRAVNSVFGTIATAILFDDKDEFLLTTNNGSLYTLTNNKDFLIFASEKFILNKIFANTRLKEEASEIVISQLVDNTGMLLNYYDFKIERFLYSSIPSNTKSSVRVDKLTITEKSIGDDKEQLDVLVNMTSIAANPLAASEKKLLEYNIDRISKLKRCTKCLLPETFPFIEFDEKGICNICNNYVMKNEPKPIEELQELVEPYRRKDGQPDCLVPFSGGRDSTYTLHIVKNILKMNPIAFTYDWGMVTDLGRRNIARVCGKLGVENIIVSADIHWKRENIRKNILAWLKNPELGMIPLFMAGDKFFFYYTDKVKKQNDIKLNIWGINNLENTDFKVGFCGVPPRSNKKRIYSLTLSDQFKLFSFVGENILRSPSYINQSILDTLGSFASRYFAKKEDYYHMFDYYRWDEKEIEDLIISEYKWETAIDTKTTWRIGDGTAGFYNYVYYTVAGFSEYDTFRSNQIREGMLGREEALELVNEENRPRYESLKWYLEIVGLDFESVIKRINNIPKLY